MGGYSNEEIFCGRGNAGGASAEVVGTLREGNPNNDTAAQVKRELLAQVLDAGLSASKPSGIRDK